MYNQKKSFKIDTEHLMLELSPKNTGLFSACFIVVVLNTNLTANVNKEEYVSVSLSLLKFIAFYLLVNHRPLENGRCSFTKNES